MGAKTKVLHFLFSSVYVRMYISVYIYQITNNKIKLKCFDYKYKPINFLGNKNNGLGV